MAGPNLGEMGPVHATLRVLPHVWNLRRRDVLKVVEASLEGPKTWREFRVVHFSLQGDHLHFIVEADGNRVLSEGMQGLSVRLAKGLNRLMGRNGKVFADRFHAHVLRTPAGSGTPWRTCCSTTGATWRGFASRPRADRIPTPRPQRSMAGARSHRRR